MTGSYGSQGCKGDKGDKGATGAQGAQGATGARGPGGQIGNKGAQGDKGDKGNRGAQGYRGEQGPTGKIGCRGDQGYRGPTGDRGVPGWQGVQGPQGSIGDTGFKGPQGDDGSSVIFGTTGPSTGSTHYSGLSKIYFDENTFQIDPIDGSGIIISSGLKVGLTGSTISSYGHINTLLFDSESGFDITSGATGTAIIGMNSTFKYWQVDGNTGLQAKGLDTVNFVAGNGITITPDKTALPYQSLTIASTGGGNSDISGPPPQLTFGNISYTSRYIYIPWEYPAQSTIIGDTYLPYINSFSAYYTINDISHNIIVDGSGVNYIKGPPSTSKQTPIYITGIILTNVSTGTPTPGTCTQVQFPDNISSTWCYIHYDPSLSLLSEAGASGTITAYYSNYNTSSGVSNKTSKTLNGFSVAGIPSTSTTASFSYTYPDALLNTKNVDIAVNVINTTPYSNGSTGPWIDKDNKGASTYQIQKYKYIYESNGSTIRYDVPLADEPKDISGSSQSQTIHYLYPDASYMLYEQVNNNSSTDASYSSISDPIPFHSQSLQVRAVCSDLKFPILTNSCKSAYLVTDTNRQNLKSNVVFTEQSADVTSDPVTSPIHTHGTRGNLVPIGTTLLDISCTITKSGSPTPIDSVSISYKGFDTTYNIPTGSSGQGICTIAAAAADAIPVDSYADSLPHYKGFYLETSNNVITLPTNSSTLFSASNKLNTIQLAYIRRNNVLDTTSTDISYSSYSFYYDPYSTAPVWTDVAFTPTLHLLTTITPICGVKIITGEIIVKGVTIISNGGLGNYFYNNGHILTYTIYTIDGSTSIPETTLTKVTNQVTSLANGKFVYPVTFDNNSTIKFTPSTYNTSFNVQLTDVKNCLGNSPSTGSAPAATTYKGIFDKASVTAATATTSIPTTASASGCRVVTGTMITAAVAGAATAYRGVTSGSIDLSMNTLYVNSASIKDTNDLLFSDGYYTTPDSTTPASRTKGYLNYTSVYNNSLCNQDCGDYSSVSTTTFDGYRYATFAWKLPVSTGQYANAIIKINGLFGFDTGTAGSYPASDNGGGKKILMTYRFQNGYADGSSLNAGDNTNEPPTTIWVQGFKGTTAVPSGGAATPTNSTEANSNGLTQSSPISTFNATGSVLTSICPMKPNFAVLSLTGTSSAYMYCIIGLPMDSYIGFSSVTASWSY